MANLSEDDRPLSAAVGRGGSWSGETGSAQRGDVLHKVQGRVLCYNETYTQSVDFTVAELGWRSALPSYDVNESGMTYGSGYNAALNGGAPDLILACGVQGRTGYHEAHARAGVAVRAGVGR